MTAAARPDERAPIAVAIDTNDREVAAKWASEVSPYVQVVKIGLELFCRTGPEIVQVVRGGSGVGLFLDLKLHDIPNTVAGAAKAVARLKPVYLTVHATGGAAMIRAAVEAAPDVRIAAVTVLTSLDDDAMASVGLAGPASDATKRLAVLAVGAGARALVCSPHEVAALRAEVGADVTLITPGVRPPGSDVGDQARVGTPAQALADGADLLVIGRPITGDPNPRGAAARIAASLRAATPTD